MMRRIFCMLMLLWALNGLNALAEDDWRVAEGMPVLNITWRDSGEASGDDLRPYLLTVDVRAEDGSLTQTITWVSNEPSDRMVAHVRLVDYNFDGFKDLQLLTAQGARNVFYAVALWDEEKGCYREVERHCQHLPGGKIDQEITQVEFCNPEFYPDGNPWGRILSVEADGYAYSTEYVYGWESRYDLETYWVASVYDAGDGLIGESLEQWGTGLVLWWDQTYPESWYYGEGNASAKRTEARRVLMLGRGTVGGCSMMVDNVSWVNLRQLDSKASPSLAKLNRGEMVQLLATGCGEDGGWMLVYVPADHTSDDDHELDGMTGYIWHSYLEPYIMYVANVDWVNVCAEADKASPVIATLNAGHQVRRDFETDGWIRVRGWHEGEGGDRAPSGATSGTAIWSRSPHLQAMTHKTFLQIFRNYLNFPIDFSSET